jgi:hypothetical protein
MPMTTDEAWIQPVTILRAGSRPPRDGGEYVVVTPIVVNDLPVGAAAEHETFALDLPPGVALSGEEIVTERRLAHERILETCARLGRAAGQRLRKPIALLELARDASVCEARAAVRALRARGAKEVIADVTDASIAIAATITQDGCVTVGSPHS